jgi:DNA gyrase subunit A
VLTVTDKGQGKRTDISEYRVQTRGGKGIINLKVTSRTGLIVGSKFINETQDIMLISAAGIIIRMNASDISTYGRNAQGVKLMDLEPGDKVAALAIVNTVGDEE